jgi:16S rRNA (guanine527-N7)-methyltransferase
MRSANDLRNWLSPYGVEPSEDKITQFMKYLDLLLLWNRRMSLTSLIDAKEIVQVLFGESVAVIPMLGIRGGRLADVGSGAGFPGLPLKIMVPELKLTLIEPNLKKSVFLEEVSRRLGMANVDVARMRLNRMETQSDGYDWVTSRALAERDQILQFCGRSLCPDGKVVLWVGEEEAGKLEENRAWRWDRIHRIPKTDQRIIVAGKIVR